MSGLLEKETFGIASIIYYPHIVDWSTLLLPGIVSIVFALGTLWPKTPTSGWPFSIFQWFASRVSGILAGPILCSKDDPQKYCHSLKQSRKGSDQDSYCPNKLKFGHDPHSFH